MSLGRSPQTFLWGFASSCFGVDPPGLVLDRSPHHFWGTLSAAVLSVLRNFNFLSSCTFTVATRKLPRFCNSGNLLL